jgi:hypothetical protein
LESLNLLHLSLFISLASQLLDLLALLECALLLLPYPLLIFEQARVP